MAWALVLFYLQNFIVDDKDNDADSCNNDWSPIWVGNFLENIDHNLLKNNEDKSNQTRL